MTQAPDTPTSPSTAQRWTFYRRLGLLLRTRLDEEGATLSLHEVAARTHGRVPVEELIGLLRQGPLAQPDAVTCVLLAQAFDIDPDFFVTDAAVEDYISSIRAAAANVAADHETSLQMLAYRATQARSGQRAVLAH